MISKLRKLKINLSDSRSKRIIFYWLPFIFYSLLIIYLSHQPHIDLKYDPGDKTLHFLEYFGYALLLIRILIIYNIKNIAFWTITISTLYGISDELHQYFIPGRHCTFGDVAIDIVGAGTILLIFKLIRKFYPGV